ncbi:hypothetical protein FRC02_009766 [Tulasnella sp. 418]|nr:hypothetical protein FRC02_009766 [Tulasnella sp. 418]
MAFEANRAYGPPVEHNYTMLQAFEWYVEGGGKHWKKLTAEIPRLSQMGITAMWLPPATKASSENSVGYDIYDLYDLGEFDRNGTRRTNYGTKEELLETIKTGRENGILTYMDAVLNHKFGADRTERFQAREVAWDDRNRDLTDWKEIEGWTGYDFPGRNGKYSSFKWNYNHFSGVDYNEDGDRKAIYRIWGMGKSWPQRVDREHGNYAFLMGADIDHAHPDVSNDLYNWGTWIMNELGVGGFRFDAVKHFDSSFMASFVNQVRARSNKPLMFCVGEFWKDSVDDLSRYLDDLGTQFSVFDTPLHYNFKEAGDRGNAFDLRSIWDGTIVQRRPVDAVTLVDNHE